MTGSSDPWGGMGPGGWDPHPTPTPPPPAPDPHQNQGQGQLEGQGQGQLQGQGELQGQGQSQSSSSDSDNWNGNGNWDANGNGNGNLNGNGNGNLNGNANLDANANGNLNGNANLNDDINHNVNANLNSTDVHVSVCVDATVATAPSAPSAPVIDMSHLDLGGNNGIFFQMPDFGTQSLSGDGSIFHLDQVNNLVNNSTLSDISGGGLSVGGYGGDGGSGYDPCCCDAYSAPGGGGGSGGAFNFSQTGSASGANATGGAMGDHSPLSGGISAANSISQEAFTQHIVLGSNIQYNSMPITVVGGDSMSDIGGAATGGYHHT